MNRRVNRNLCGKPKHRGAIKYHIKGEPLYRTMEDVASVHDAKVKIAKLHKGAEVDYLSEVDYYEDFSEACRRHYYKQLFKNGDKNEPHV